MNRTKHTSLQKKYEVDTCMTICDRQCRKTLIGLRDPIPFFFFRFIKPFNSGITGNIMEFWSRRRGAKLSLTQQTPLFTIFVAGVICFAISPPNLCLVTVTHFLGVNNERPSVKVT